MALKDDVERILKQGSGPKPPTPPGYEVRETEHGAPAVVYPDDAEVSLGDAGSPSSISPGQAISDCADLLALEGYDAELVPADRHHVLVIRGRMYRD